MEDKDWEEIKKEPGEYIAAVVSLHLNDVSKRIETKLERLGTKPWTQTHRSTSWEKIEPLLKEKWQDLTQEKRNETIRIFHHVSEAVREGLTDWFDSLKAEIENLAKGGEYSGAYLGSYGHKAGPWNILDEVTMNLTKIRGVIRTVLAAMTNEEQEDIASTLDVADDLICDVEKEVNLSMDIISGKSPKKNEKGQG